MGIFDRFAAKKPASGAAPQEPAPAEEPAVAAAPPAAAESAGDVRRRLNEARAKLDARDQAGALAIYEEVLASAGQRADVLLTVSGDLGTTGNAARIIELIAPRYDASRHGPAVGLNLLQAYIAVQDAEAAQHTLDLLFDLKRPDLEERLYGFSNAIAELMTQDSVGGVPAAAGQALPPPATPDGGSGSAPAGSTVAFASISKPIWFYGLESLGEQILPPKDGRQRRIAFVQLALPGAYPDLMAAMDQPEDALARLSRALPLWFAEAFYFSPPYAPIAVVGHVDRPGGSRRPLLFGAEWSMEHLRQLVETAKEGLDYVFTGALRQRDGDYEILLRLWEIKRFRERKQFSARWTPATADAQLAKLQEDVRRFMEWTPHPAPAGIAYAQPRSPGAWVDLLGTSLGLFLADKKVFPRETLPAMGPLFSNAAAQAAESPAASLAWLTLCARARSLGVAPAPLPAPPLSHHPLVEEAAALLS